MKNKKLSILDLPHNYDIINPLYQMSKWEDFCLTIESKWDIITSTVRSVFTGIYNIFIYMPIIWNTREWDYGYLIDLIEFKLKRIKKQINKDNFVVETPKICDEIQYTLDCIYRYKNHTEIYEEEHQDDLRDVINAINKNKQDELQSQYFTKSYEDEEKTWCEIWDSIKENMYGWWD